MASKSVVVGGHTFRLAGGFTVDDAEEKILQDRTGALRGWDTIGSTEGELKFVGGIRLMRKEICPLLEFSSSVAASAASKLLLSTAESLNNWLSSGQR
jgi:hypothetical protein